MPDNDAIPVPQGASLMGGSQTQPQGASQATPNEDGTLPVPQGAKIASPRTMSESTSIPTDIGPSPAQALGQTVMGIGKGMGQALESTIEGGGHVVRSVLGMPQVNNLNRTELQPQTLNEKIGYGGETLLEFLSGEGAVDAAAGKAISLSDKWAQAAKVAKILESNSKLMTAVKIGANAMKAGAVQGAQTYARTGGDTGEAVKSGAKMGATAGVLGTVGAGIEKLGKGLTSGAEASNKLTEAAKDAVPKSETAALFENNPDKTGFIEQSKNDLHRNYENTIENLKDRAGDTTVDPVKDEVSGKPAMADKAEELLRKPIPTDHELVSGFKSIRGEKLDGSVKRELRKIATGYSEPEKFDAWKEQQDEIKAGNLVEKDGQVFKANEFKKYNESQQPNAEGQPSGVKTEAPKGEPLLEEPKKLAPYDLDSLIKLRQEMRQVAKDYEPGNTNARTLVGKGSLTEGIDDTIAQLTKKVPDDKIVDDYSNMRKYYADRINIYDSPVVKNLAIGKYDDAMKAVLSGNSAQFKIGDLRTILGDERMDDFAHKSFGNMLQDAQDKTGQVNAAKLIGMWNKIPEETREGLFNTKTSGADIAKSMEDAGIARNIQYLSRVGVVGPAIAAGGQFTHLGLIGVLLAEGAAGGVGAIPKVKEVLDYVANHPKMWKAIKATGEGLQSVGGGTAGQAITGATGQAITGDNQPRGSGMVSFKPQPDVKRKVYGSATGLAGKQ